MQGRLIVTKGHGYPLVKIYSAMGVNYYSSMSAYDIQGLAVNKE